MKGIVMKPLITSTNLHSLQVLISIPMEQLLSYIQNFGISIKSVNRARPLKLLRSL